MYLFILQPRGFILWQQKNLQKIKLTHLVDTLFQSYLQLSKILFILIHYMQCKYLCFFIEGIYEHFFHHCLKFRIGNSMSTLVEQ